MKILLLLVFPFTAFAAKMGDFTLKPSVYMQYRLQNEKTKSTGGQSFGTTEHEIKKARIAIKGGNKKLDMKYILDYDANKSDCTTKSCALNKAKIDLGLTNSLRLAVGAQKVPMSVQRLMSSKKQQFAERSLVNSTFTKSNDVGAVLSYKMGSITSMLSTFEGSGDVPQYGLTFVLNADELKGGESDLSQSGDLRYAVALVGHKEEVVSNYKHTYSLSTSIKKSGLAINAAYFNQTVDNSATNSSGMNFQLGKMISSTSELAVKYSSVDPQGENNDISEMGVVYNRFIDGQHLKFVLELAQKTTDTSASTEDESTKIKAQLQLYL